MNKATVKTQLDKRRILKNNAYPVRLIIYFNGKKKRYSTTKRIFLTKKEWEKVNSPRLKQGNLISTKTYINKEVARATKIIEDLELSGSEFSFELFDALFIENKKRITLSRQHIYPIFEDYIKTLKDEERIGTAAAYESALNSLRTFAPKLLIKDIGPKFLYQYEKWMLDNKRSISTVGIYMRSFRTIVNIAKDI